MKVTNYNVVAAMISELLPEKCPDLLENIGEDSAIWCVMGIYLTNDQTTGYGQDFGVYAGVPIPECQYKVSVISSPTRISVIFGAQMSYYQDRITICGYEDLEEDLTNIMLYIQTAFDRITTRP